MRSVVVSPSERGRWWSVYSMHAHMQPSAWQSILSYCTSISLATPRFLFRLNCTINYSSQATIKALKPVCLLAMAYQRWLYQTMARYSIHYVVQSFRNSSRGMEYTMCHTSTPYHSATNGLTERAPCVDGDIETVQDLLTFCFTTKLLHTQLLASISLASLSFWWEENSDLALICYNLTNLHRFWQDKLFRRLGMTSIQRKEPWRWRIGCMCVVLEMDKGGYLEHVQLLKFMDPDQAEWWLAIWFKDTCQLRTNDVLLGDFLSIINKRLHVCIATRTTIT